MTNPIWIPQVIDDFGKMLGLEGLDFDENGLLQIKFDEFGIFGLEQAERRLLAYLMRPMPRPDAQVYRRALQLCHYDESPCDWLQAALLPGSQLALATSIRNEDVHTARLEQTLQTLSDLHDLLEQEAE